MVTNDYGLTIASTTGTNRGINITSTTGTTYTSHKAITPDIANLFDELYQRVDQGLNLELDFLARLNAANLVLLPIINEEIAVAQTIVDVNK